MFSFRNFLLLLNVAFICSPAFVKMNVRVLADNFETDLVHLDTVGDVLKNAIRNGETSNDASVAAAELDVLMPPIELNETLAEFADVRIAPLEVNDNQKESDHHAPNWWRTYDAFLLALGMIIMLLLMTLFTHCLWRRHLERRDVEWEAESARIFHNTPYYSDRCHILVY